jgi:hypothetical protein
MKLLFIFFTAIFLFQSRERPQVSFTEEYIEFRLRETTFTVNGNYFFVNNTPGLVSKEITYPFPVPMSDIDSVRIFNIAEGKLVQYHKSDRAVVFHLNIQPSDTMRLNIFYREKGIRDTVHYILTTTKNWGEPLQKAQYTFETERNRNIKSFSYPPDNSSRTNKAQKYSWTRKNFLPDKDFIVVFKSPTR